MENLVSQFLAWIVGTFFMSPLLPHAYLCHHESGYMEMEEIVFSYSNSQVAVFEWRIQVGGEYEMPLKAEHTGGSSAASVAANRVQAEVIQDVVKVKLRLASGEISEDVVDYGKLERLKDIRRYHAVIPTSNHYDFNPQTKTLVWSTPQVICCRRARLSSKGLCLMPVVCIPKLSPSSRTRSSSESSATCSLRVHSKPWLVSLWTKTTCAMRLGGLRPPKTPMFSGGCRPLIPPL